MAKLSLQLYSLKNETSKDFLGTLEKVAKMGYDGVLNHKAIVDAALEYNKPEWLIIEWEDFESGNDLKAVENCLNNLKKML